MSDGTTSTVGLNLDGSFAAQAEKDAAAARALDAALGKVEGHKGEIGPHEAAVSAQLQRQVSLAAQISTFDAGRVRAIAQQEAQLKRMTEEATKGVTGGKGGDSLVSDLAVAQALERAGEKLITAGVELAKSAAELVAAGEKLAIEQTSKREVDEAVFGKLGGDREMVVQTALKLGLDPEAAKQEAKKLLNAHFPGGEIPDLLKIKAGMDLEGLDGDALLKKLEGIKLGSKVGTKDIEGLKKLGVDVNAVYAQIAKDLGITVPAAQAKVKAGAVDSAEAIKAIEAATARQFGGLADKAADTVPALAARVKGDLMEMFAFDPKLLEPIKEVLHSVISAIEGDEGKAIKASLSELFDALNHAVLDEFRGDEGKAKLKAFAREAATSIHEFAQAVHEAAPAIKLLERLAETGTAGAPGFLKLLDGVTGLSQGFAQLGAIEKLIEDIDNLDDAAANLDLGQIAVEFLDMIGQLFGFDLFGGGSDLGGNLVQGMVEGIENGASAAISAAEEMANNALAAAKNALGVHSPSTEFAEVGGYSAEGMAQGLTGHPGPAEAGAKMAKGALDAASGQAAGASAAGASAAEGGAKGGDMHITFEVHSTGGGGAAKEWAAMLPVIEPALRRMVRDAREGAGA